MIVSASLNRLDQDGELDPPLPAMPTLFWCGSREKLDIMRERVESGEAVFHPGDSVECKPAYFNPCFVSDRNKFGR